MKTPILKDGQIFKTIFTSKRHRELGYCEPSDFGSIELIRLRPEEKKLIVSFRDSENEPVTEYIEHKGIVYKKMGKSESIGHLSREEDTEQGKMQGKYTDRKAIALLLKLRERKRANFSGMSDDSYIIIGNTLYADYCELKSLTITVASNLAFSYWLSIDIESHGGKQQIKLNKKNFDRVVKTERKRFEDGKPKEGTRRGDGHVHFSCPVEVKWGERYK